LLIIAVKFLAHYVVKADVYSGQFHSII